MEVIYQDIWNADQQQNGLPAIRPGEPGDFRQGFVRVDERATTVGSDFRVLQEVQLPDHKKSTYALCEKLFNNYALERAATEIIRPEESQEELDFIDAIVPTAPIQVARTYLEQSLNLSISDSMLAAMIKETWFAFGTAGSQRDASGFEHVFVGEQSSSANKIGGYHFWYKYFLDDGGRTQDMGERVDRIEYHGTRYQGAEQAAHGILVPEVVTLSLVWHAPGGDNGQGRTLTKPIGGFFVGCSPEGLIALGLVRCRSQSGKIANINGAEYQLDLHRLDDRPNAIRTFFPRFRKAEVTRIVQPSDNPVTPADPHIPAGSNPVREFRILAAMVNPVNPEGGREFVQLINLSNQTASLEGWQVVAPNGTGFVLDDISIAPGDTFKFVLPTAQGVLRNSHGQITLRNPTGNIEDSFSYSSEQSAHEGSVITI